jgi:purine-nucleoside phosphorylase
MNEEPTRRLVGESAAAVRLRTGFKPEIGIVLGTGLTRLAKEVKVEAEIAYSDIPHFARPTVESHAGRIVLGTLSDRKVALMCGRFHYYEGFEPWQIAHPVRLMKELGVRTLVLSNAAGGLNPQFSAGDLMVITDHINLTGVNPLRGPNDESLGPRFPDMFECYDPKLAGLAESTALSLGLALRRGVYAWVTGPNLETAAEYRYLRTIGADAVGMSTVPEVIVAKHSGLRVLGLSVITDMGLPDAMRPVDLPEVLSVAGAAEPKLNRLLIELVKQL